MVSKSENRFSEKIMLKVQPIALGMRPDCHSDAYLTIIAASDGARAACVNGCTS
jgi:hypothetical protein